MLRLPAAFVPIDGLEARRSDAVLVHGGHAFISEDGRLTAVRLRDRVVAWQAARARPAPECFQVPRRIWCQGRRLWAGDGLVGHLAEGDEGAVLVAYDLSSGAERWRTEIPLPPPLSWTEPRPAWDRAHTEELDAFLLDAAPLAVAVARTTRRTMVWPEHPAPEFHAQLDLVRIDPDDGRVLWSTSVPEASVPILETRCFAGWHLAGGRVGVVDWSGGAATTIAGPSGEAGWPRLVDRGVAVASRSRGAIGVELFHPVTGERLSGARWRRNGVRAVRLFSCAGLPVLQVNDQHVSLLGADLTPRWEVRVIPYVYGVAAHAEGPVFVATSGNGGGLYAINRARGEVVAERRIPGGAWDLVPVDGTPLVAAACGDGVVLSSASDPRVELAALPGATAVAGSHEGQIVVLGAGARPGVHLMDVRRAFD